MEIVQRYCEQVTNVPLLDENDEQEETVVDRKRVC